MRPCARACAHVSHDMFSIDNNKRYVLKLIENTFRNLARVAVAHKIDKIVHVSRKDMHSTVAQCDVIACGGRDKSRKRVRACG